MPDPVCRARGVSGSGGVGAWAEGLRGATSESAQLPGFVAGAGRRLVREMLLCPVGRPPPRSCRGSGSSSDPSEWLRVYVGIPTPTVIPHAGPRFRAGAHGPSPRVPSTAPGTCDHSGNAECRGADGLCLIADLFFDTENLSHLPVVSSTKSNLLLAAKEFCPPHPAHVLKACTLPGLERSLPRGWPQFLSLGAALRGHMPPQPSGSRGL